MLGLYERGDRVEYYRMNREFHTAIVGIVGNAVLSATYATLTAQAQRARFIAIHAQAYWDRGVREHERMIELLEARDGAALGDLLTAHTLGTGLRVRAILAERDPENASPPTTD